MQIDLIDTLRRLAAADLPIILCGGLAAVAHGSLELTRDIDLIPADTGRHLGALLDALEALHFEPEAPLTFPTLRTLIQSDRWSPQEAVAIRLHSRANPALVIDIVVAEAVRYREYRERCAMTSIDGHELAVASIDDLIAMKEAAGRAKDVAALEELYRLRDLQRQDSEQ